VLGQRLYEDGGLDLVAGRRGHGSIPIWLRAWRRGANLGAGEVAEGLVGAVGQGHGGIEDRFGAIVIGAASSLSLSQ
jgi:hypothetical protein